MPPWMSADLVMMVFVPQMHMAWSLPAMWRFPEQMMRFALTCAFSSMVTEPVVWMEVPQWPWVMWTSPMQSRPAQWGQVAVSAKGLWCDDLAQR